MKLVIDVNEDDYIDVNNTEYLSQLSELEIVSLIYAIKKGEPLSKKIHNARVELDKKVVTLGGGADFIKHYEAIQILMDMGR